jgi:hypothetical protein
MNFRANRLFTAILIAVVALMVAIGGFLPMQEAVQAAPPAAPTPVASPDNVGGGQFFRFQPQTAIAADTNTSALDVMEFETVDVQYVIDQGTVNTTTLTIQYSIDGSNYTDGAALVSSNAADASAVVARVPVYGRYMRIKQDLTNTNTITITLLAVGR